MFKYFFGEGAGDAWPHLLAMVFGASESLAGENEAIPIHWVADGESLVSFGEVGWLAGWLAGDSLSEWDWINPLFSGMTATQRVIQRSALYE